MSSSFNSTPGGASDGPTGPQNPSIAPTTLPTAPTNQPQQVQQNALEIDLTPARVATAVDPTSNNIVYAYFHPKTFTTVNNTHGTGPTEPGRPDHRATLCRKTNHRVVLTARQKKQIWPAFLPVIVQWSMLQATGTGARPRVVSSLKLHGPFKEDGSLKDPEKPACDFLFTHEATPVAGLPTEVRLRLSDGLVSGIVLDQGFYYAELTLNGVAVVNFPAQILVKHDRHDGRKKDAGSSGDQRFQPYTRPSSTKSKSGRARTSSSMSPTPSAGSDLSSSADMGLFMDSALITNSSALASSSSLSSSVGMCSPVTYASTASALASASASASASAQAFNVAAQKGVTDPNLPMVPQNGLQQGFLSTFSPLDMQMAVPQYLLDPMSMTMPMPGAGAEFLAAELPVPMSPYTLLSPNQLPVAANVPFNTAPAATLPPLSGHFDMPELQLGTASPFINQSLVTDLEPAESLASVPSDMSRTSSPDTASLISFSSVSYVSSPILFATQGRTPPPPATYLHLPSLPTSPMMEDGINLASEAPANGSADAHLNMFDLEMFLSSLD